MNVLLLTSCNRIKQTIFALTLNSFIIKEPFFVIISDCSTPHFNFYQANKFHQQKPYNYIQEYNYNSDINLFNSEIKHLNKIINFKIIHIYPWMNKDIGDTTLTAMGLCQSCLLDIRENEEIFCLKLSGSTILKTDELSVLSDKLKNKDVLVYCFSEKWFSTKIFGCKPKKLTKTILEYGFNGWISDEKYFVEEKFTDILNNNYKNELFITNLGESSVCLNCSGEQKTVRNKAIDMIERYNISKDIPIIQEFFKGGIW